MKKYFQISLGLMNLYVLFGILFSDFGLKKISQLEILLQQNITQLQAITNENNDLTWQIENLNNKNIDNDFLDMILKKYIFYSDNNEKLIITDDGI
jgi:cell division protein FtsB